MRPLGKRGAPVERAAATVPPVLEVNPTLEGRPTTSTWPVVLGVLSIIAGLEAMRLYGHFDPLCTATGVARCIGEGRFDLLIGYFGVGGLFYIGLSLCAGVLGIVGGILLLLRRRISLVLHWLYALAQVAALSLFVTDRLQWRYRAPYLLLYDPLTRVGLSLVYPVLVMVWFSRPAVWRHARLWRRRAGRMASKPAGPIWPVVLGALTVYWGATGVLASSRALGLSMACDLKSFRWNVYYGTTMADRVMLGPAALAIISGALLWRRKRAGAALCWLYIAAALIMPLRALVPTLNCLVDAAGTGFLRMVWRQSGPELLIRRTLHTVKLLAWPVFLMIWLARPKIRAQVRSWGRRRGAGLDSLADRVY